MYIRIVHRQRWQNIGTALIALLITWLFLQYPNAVHNGINRGLSICGTVIIPTLFPFMLLAGWLADSPLCRNPGRWAKAIARRGFGLPGCCAPAILLSLVGGYPAGMVAISRLYRQKQIQYAEMRQMTAFCLCGGPGFIVGTVGIGLLGSVQAGWWLYMAQALSAIGVGVWLGRKHRIRAADTAPLPPRRPFARMMADTCGALLCTCGFVTAAAMALSLWEGIGFPRGIAALTGWPIAMISAAAAGVLEVSCGCLALTGMPMAPLWLSWCLSWGGLSVHGQLAATLPEENVIGLPFLGWRILHSVFSGVIAMGLFHFFPPKRSVDNSWLSPLPFSVSSTATAMLLLLCFLTMLCFSEKKTGKSQQSMLY